MFRIKILFIFLFACIASPTIVFGAGQQLANLISQTNPNISLLLATNGPNQPPYPTTNPINYGVDARGDVPFSSDPGADWSAFNVKDLGTGIYYGTLNFKSDGNTVSFVNYSPPQDGGLTNINLSFVPGSPGYYQITATVNNSPQSGPFPDAPLAQPAAYPNLPNMPIILSVSGNQIVNNLPKPILLKGIARPSLEWNAQGQYLSPGDIALMANVWKANVIRLSLNQNYWFSSQGVEVKGSYKQIINAIVFYAIQNNMAVILDLHWVVNGHQSPMANRDSIAFWMQVAHDYKEFGTVMFELFNEPFGISPTTWLHGDSTYAGYQELYNAVRSMGAPNICIIGGLDYAYDLSFVNESFRVIGENIVYNSHPYNEKGTASYPITSGGSFEHNFAGVLGKFPLIFTEFGADNNGSPPYYPNRFEPVYKRILDFATANKVNYTSWGWWVDLGDPGFPTIIQSWAAEPINGGVQVQQDMLQRPGTRINTLH